MTRTETRILAPSALLFDLDGTLVDSRRDIAAACNAARADHGLSPLPDEAIVAMVGDGARALVSRAFQFEEGDGRLDAAVASFKARYVERPCVFTTLLGGARELLAEAAEARLPCAVITNKSRDVATLVLAQLSVARFFPVMWAGGDGPLKPSPAGVVAMTTQLGVDARTAWMIGDGPQDVGAGKSAGCFTVGIPGIAERDRLLKSEPDVVCETLPDVHALWRRTREGQ